VSKTSQQNRARSRQQPSRQSLKALDRLNLSLGDVRDVFEPFLAIFLAVDQRWNPAQVGLTISTTSIVSIFAQIPAGAIVDVSKCKRTIIAISTIAVAASYLVIVHFPVLPIVVMAQAVIGTSAIIVGPTISAISLGLVGHERLEKRVGRNEAFNHTGNAIAAILAGTLGKFAGRQWIFYLFAILCVAIVISVFQIRRREINSSLSRSQDQEKDQANQPQQPAKFQDLARDRPLQILSLSVILFYFANAPLLPLISQKIAGGGAAPTLFVAASIVVAQLMMIVVSAQTGVLADQRGRKGLFLIACAAVVVRSLLYVFYESPWLLIAVQLLDGVASGIASVLVIVMVADLAKGTGRFNLTQGAINTSIGIGASLGNLTLGILAKAVGFKAVFVIAAVIAIVALGVFWVKMPETREYRSEPQ
jgi:MFS family permease